MAAASYLYNLLNRAEVNGSHKLLSCWTEGVTKFTAGSFYNFEQDNLPLYDLEERTYFNWQNAGFPSNEPHSIHLLVSAHAPEELINCNSNIFTTLQDAVDALPRNITVNTRITVASFGDLGSLRLEGITVDTNKNLEIVNLNAFDKPGNYLFDTSLPASGTKPGEYEAIVSSIVEVNDQASYGLYKGFYSSGSTNLGADGFGTGGLANFFLRPDEGVAAGYKPRVKNFDIDPYVFSSVPGTLDSRCVSAYTSFTTIVPGNGRFNSKEVELSRLSVGSVVLNPLGVSLFDYRVNNLGAKVTVREETEDAIELFDFFLYDPSSFNQMTGLASFRRKQESNWTSYQSSPLDNIIKTTLYGNSLQLVELSNCSGRIWLRGFYLNGKSAPIPLPIGIKVDGCPEVQIESCAISDYNTYGLCVVNSKVTIHRSFYVYRCYGKAPNYTALFGSINSTRVVDVSGRLSKPWTTNIKSLDAPVNDNTAGVYAVNSLIDFAEDEVFNHNFRLTAPLFDLDNPANVKFRPGNHNCRIISRCSTGLRLENSRLSGGQGPFIANYASEAAKSYKDYFYIEGNANYGIHLIHSSFKFNGGLHVFHNTRGLRVENSKIALDTFKVDHNHLYGLKLDNSHFTYGVVQLSSVEPLSDFTVDVQTQLYPKSNLNKFSYVFEANGQHILANNSTIKPGPFLDPKHLYFGRFLLVDAHGVNDQGDCLPGVMIENSDCEFIHTVSIKGNLADRILAGGHFSIKNGSTVKFLGTENCMTCMVSDGLQTFASLRKFIGVLVDDHCDVSFRGPTALYDGAVNVYAKNNSTVKFEAHKTDDTNLDISGFNLENPRNHTMVEVKAMRSCLVADNNSNIIMEDLGDYASYWDAAEGYLDSTNYDTTNKAIYTSAGFFQFYPSPNADINVYTDTRYATALTERGESVIYNGSPGNFWWGFDKITYQNDPYEFSAVTNGGLCVKAQNNSNVRVKNVHFPCGWWNTSGIIYDAFDTTDEGNFCTKLFIWNISNNSTLHADHLTVSSLYPKDAGYFGPSSIWLSAGALPAYGAPSATPDTSSLSVLDFFGYGAADLWPLKDGTVTRYGFATPQNQGPFRLYVGVDSAVNQLIHETDLGYVTQIFAQGYNTSGFLSSVDSASAVYGKLIRETETSSIAVSGFYYANEFVKCDPNSILLDESAANTFANAKNGAMGTSNRPQICSIYSARTDATGEGKASSSDRKGSGFRSPNIFDITQEN